jgi:hypothetical protein
MCYCLIHWCSSLFIIFSSVRIFNPAFITCSLIIIIYCFTDFHLSWFFQMAGSIIHEVSRKHKTNPTKANNFIEPFRFKDLNCLLNAIESDKTKIFHDIY